MDRWVDEWMNRVKKRPTLNCSMNDAYSPLVSSKHSITFTMKRHDVWDMLIKIERREEFTFGKIIIFELVKWRKQKKNEKRSKKDQWKKSLPIDMYVWTLYMHMWKTLLLLIKQKFLHQLWAPAPATNTKPWIQRAHLLLLFYCKYQVQIVFSLVFPFDYYYLL